MFKLSIVLNLYKQTLLRQKNDAELQLLRNNAQKTNFLGTHQGRYSLEDANSFENRLDCENIAASAQLSAINAELNALNGSNNSSLNYFA